MSLLGSFDVQRPSRAESCCFPGGSIFSRRPFAAFGVDPNDMIWIDKLTAYISCKLPAKRCIEAKTFLVVASVDGLSHVDICHNMLQYAINVVICCNICCLPPILQLSADRFLCSSGLPRDSYCAEKETWGFRHLIGKEWQDLADFTVSLWSLWMMSGKTGENIWKSWQCTISKWFWNFGICASMNFNVTWCVKCRITGPRSKQIQALQACAQLCQGRNNRCMLSPVWAGGKVGIPGNWISWISWIGCENILRNAMKNNENTRKRVNTRCNMTSPWRVERNWGEHYRWVLHWISLYECNYKIITVNIGESCTGEFGFVLYIVKSHYGVIC